MSYNEPDECREQRPNERLPQQNFRNVRDAYEYGQHPPQANKERTPPPRRIDRRPLTPQSSQPSQRDHYPQQPVRIKRTTPPTQLSERGQYVQPFKADDGIPEPWQVSRNCPYPKPPNRKRIQSEIEKYPQAPRAMNQAQPQAPRAMNQPQQQANLPLSSTPFENILAHVRKMLKKKWVRWGLVIFLVLCVIAAMMHSGNGDSKPSEPPVTKPDTKDPGVKPPVVPPRPPVVPPKVPFDPDRKIDIIAYYGNSGNKPKLIPKLLDIPYYYNVIILTFFNFESGGYNYITQGPYDQHFDVLKRDIKAWKAKGKLDVLGRQRKILFSIGGANGRWP
eukprot:510369_1